MKLISEYKLDKATIKMYRDKGFEIYYGYENPIIRKGEAVGILLDSMYKSTIELIEYLLFTKHKITVKYKDTSYKLQSLDEWHRTYTENKRTMHFKHKLLIEYEGKRQEYLDKLASNKNKEYQQYMLEQYDMLNKPKDLDAFVDTFSRLYNLNVDMSNDIEKIICYNQLKTYIDLGLPYRDYSSAESLEAQEFIYSNCIDVSETPFSEAMFQPSKEEPIIIIESYGNEVFMEDIIYKES